MVKTECVRVNKSLMGQLRSIKRETKQSVRGMVELAVENYLKAQKMTP